MNKEILKNIKELTLDSPLDNMFERIFFYQVLKATPDDVIDLADTPKELHDMLLFADEELAEDYKKTVCTFAVNRFMRYMSLGENMNYLENMYKSYKKYKLITAQNLQDTSFTLDGIIDNASDKRVLLSLQTKEGGYNYRTIQASNKLMNLLRENAFYPECASIEFIDRKEEVNGVPHALMIVADSKILASKYINFVPLKQVKDIITG